MYVLRAAVHSVDFYQRSKLATTSSVQLTSAAPTSISSNLFKTNLCVIYELLKYKCNHFVRFSNHSLVVLFGIINNLFFIQLI